MSKVSTVLFERHIYSRGNLRRLKFCYVIPRTYKSIYKIYQSQSFFTANLAANKDFKCLYVLVLLQGVWIIR
jgi:hypothetical protein